MEGCPECCCALPHFVDFQLVDGSTTSFWDARWCGDLALRYRFSKLFAESRRNRKHLSVSYWFGRFATSINLGFAAPLNILEHTEVQQLAILIHSTQLAINSNDSPLWRWSISCKFSVQSAYAFLSLDGVNNTRIYFLWKLKIPPRIKLFLWLAARNKLLTTDLLAKRGWHGPSIDVLCNSDAETLQHLFCGCPLSSSLWCRLLGPSVVVSLLRDSSA